MSNAANPPTSGTPRPPASPGASAADRDPAGRLPDQTHAERRRMLRVQVRLAVTVLVVLVAFAILTAVPATALLGTALLVAAAATSRPRCGPTPT